MISHPSRRLPFLIVATILAALLLTTVMISRSHATGFQQQTKLDNLVKRHDTLTLDLKAVSSQARESGRLLLSTPTMNFDLDLSLHDMRADNYRAEEVGQDGITRSIEMGATRTYKGHVRGMDGAQARLTISEETIEGVIMTAAEQYYVEPASRYSETAEPGELVLYKASDILENPSFNCGVTLRDEINSRAERVISNSAIGHEAVTQDVQPFSPMRLTEVATEADFEYVTALGSSSAANNEILSIMNMVDGVYESNLGITFIVVYQHSWATSDEPYKATVSIDMLNEFRNYWNTHFDNVSRDLTHLFTNRRPTDGPAGIASLGVVCSNPRYAYGFSVRFPYGPKHIITAHEIGHNFGASHPDQQSPPVAECANTIMQGSSSPQTSATFCSFSRAEISNYTASNSACLTTLPANCSTYILSSSYSPFDASGGSGGVTVAGASGCAWTAISNVAWVSITSGNNSAGSGVVNYMVAPNTGNAFRTGTITIANQTFTVSQAGAVPSCTTISPPIAWWRAEGSAADSFAINNGSLVGGATYDNGEVGRAFSFDGISGYFYAPTTGLPSGSSNRTIELWVKAESMPNKYGTLAYYGGGSGEGTGYRIYTGNDRLYFAQGGAPIGDVAMQPSQWHHVAVTNQSTSVTLYLDGRAVASKVLPINTTSGSSFFLGNGLKGLIDEVAVYDRALTGVEIHSIFAAGITGKCERPPTMDGFSPASGVVGTVVTLTGTNFTKANVVKFNNTNATFSVTSDTVISATVPSGATTGVISVAAPTGKSISTGNFTVFQVPTITGFSPSSGTIGQSVVITGTNFAGTSAVSFGSTLAAFAVNSATQITATVPNGASNSVITVTAPGGTATSVNSFIIKPTATPTPSPSPTATPSPTVTPMPKTVQFSTVNYSIGEGAGLATITITRTGDTSSPASVDYSTSDNTAKQRTDYTTATGTLSFAAGQTTQSFTVLVIDNARVDGNRTVNLSLSNPVGVALGDTKTATLTIQDNDTGQPTTNPIDDARFFVRQQYLDFLNRDPDPGGFDYWTSAITSCNGDPQCINSRRVSVSAAFFIELEFQETGGYIYSLYKASYGQQPTYAQFIPDRSRVVGGANLDAGKQAFADAWVLRPDFLAKYPATMQQGDFVDTLIATVKATTSGVVDLTSQRVTLLATLQVSGRGSVVRQVAENAAFKQAEYNKAFVLMQYFGYLRRDPDQGGYNFWLDVLNNRVQNNYRGMVCAFITSAEYQDRFSSVITRNDSICGSIGP